MAPGRFGLGLGSDVMAKTLNKIQTDDPRMNRIQDNVINTLNPVLRNITAGYAVTGTTSDPVVKSILAALVKAGIVKDQTG
jgi:hypothetical protein